MPSVASEVHKAQSVHARLTAGRSQSTADTPTTPFADLLDSASPATEPSRPAQSDRAEPSDRANATKPEDSKKADAVPSQNTTAANNAKDADSTQIGKEADTEGKNVTVAKNTAAETKIDVPTPGGKPKTNGDKAAAPDATVVDPAASAVTSPQVAPVAATQPATTEAAAVPTDETASEAGTVAALQTAGQRTAAPKTAEGQNEKQGNPSVDAKTGAKTDAAADIKADATPDTKADAAAGAKKDATAGTKPEVEAGAKTSLKAGAESDIKSGTKSEAPAGKQTESLEPADPQAVAPAATDGQTHSDGDNAAASLRHAVADLLKKFDPDAPLQRRTGAADATGTAKAGADASQNIGAATQASAANATATNASSTAASAPAQTPAAAIPLAGLAIEIVSQARADNHRFEIRLDPPELGRIDVRLDVDRDGNVSTHLVADRSDTLDLLKRDQVQLERALQDAGLKTSDNALQFSLRQQGFAQDNGANQNAPAQTQVIVPDDDPAPLEALRQGYGRLLGLGGGLDIRI